MSRDECGLSSKEILAAISDLDPDRCWCGRMKIEPIVGTPFYFQHMHACWTPKFWPYTS